MVLYLSPSRFGFRFLYLLYAIRYWEYGYHLADHQADYTPLARGLQDIHMGEAVLPP